MYPKLLPQSARLRELHTSICETIPCPDEDFRTDLKEMHLGELLMLHVAWADRLIPPRPRKVVTWDGLFRFGKYAADKHRDALTKLSAKIEAGENLRPNLSQSVMKTGYVRPGLSKKTGKPKKTWEDKDYALNCYETHHLHLSEKIRRDGWAERTTDLAYVSFGRDDAFIVMIGDHKSFDDGSLLAAMTEVYSQQPDRELKGVLGPSTSYTLDERNSLQRAGMNSVYSANGKVYLGPVISTAGTSDLHMRHTSEIRWVLNEIDPLLDDPGFQEKLFSSANTHLPPQPEFDWVLNYCDLLLKEKKSGIYFEYLRWRR